MFYGVASVSKLQVHDMLVRAQQWLGSDGQPAGLEFLPPSHIAIRTDHKYSNMYLHTSPFADRYAGLLGPK